MVTPKAIRVIYKITKEPLGYFVDVVGGGVIFVVFASWLASNLNSLNIWFKIGGFIALCILLLAFIKNIKSVFNYLQYTFDLKTFEIGSGTATQVGNRRDYPVDYSKFVPKTEILEYLQEKALSIARKFLARDAILTRITLFLTIDIANKKILENTVMFKSWSNLKRLNAVFWADRFRLIYSSIPKSWQLEYAPRARHLTTPFFKVKDWREAVITAFQRVEHEFLKEPIHAQISMVGEDVSMHFTKRSPVTRSYSFSFRDGVLYEGYYLKGISPEPPEIVVDFNK